MRKLGLIYIFLMLASLLKAQTVTVSAPSSVSTGENFRIAYTVSTQDVDEFRAGNIPAGIEVIAGPYTSSQSSFQMVNGHTSSSSSITYTYTLYAEKPGTYTIPAAHVRIGGHTVASKVVKIHVTGAAKKNGSMPQMHDDGGPDLRSAGSRISANDLFVKVSANKKRVHEQEPILLTYKVYTLVDLTQLEGKMPDLTGFHTQEVPLPAQKSAHIEKVNGRNYRCVTWSQYVMFPQMTGKLKIPSITFKGIVVQQNRDVDPFEAFFNGGSGYVEVKRDIVAPGMDVQVDPLPAKPVGFSGGVGRFTISAQANHTSVKAGQPVTVRVVVSGTGNLKLIKQPVLELPKDFDKYDPKVTDKTKLTANGIEGNMVYDFLIVPRNQGRYTIPPVSLPYYDTGSESYRTVKTQPITLDVAKGDASSATVDDYSQAKADDIQALKTGDCKLMSSSYSFFASAQYWTLLAVPFIVFVVLLVIFRKRAIDNADIVKMKGKKANKVAIRRLRRAEKLKSAGHQGEFYDEVLRALWGYVGDKLNMAVENLSRENIAEKLRLVDISSDTIGKFINAIDECEYERYAPGDAAGNMDKTYNTAIEAIMDIENSIKHNRKRTAKSRVQAVILLFVMSLCASTASAMSKGEADSAYIKGNYQQAIAGYNEILKSGVSAEVYYNLGNAYFRTDNIAQAVLAYERARLLSPGDKDIQMNLDFVRSKTIDKVNAKSEMFFVVFYNYVVNMLSVDGWAVLSVMSVVAMLLLLLVYLFGSSLLLRKIGFYGAAVGMLLFAFGMLFAFQQKRSIDNCDVAVVVSPVANVKKTPADSGSDAFVIHEGTRVHIIDPTMKGWWGIALDDGREGWLKRQLIETVVTMKHDN